MDVDIDIGDRTQLLALIDHIPASIFRNNELIKHNTGIYFQNIPYDPMAGCSSIEHHAAATRGYFKIDILNVSAYHGVKSEEHLITLQNQEPIWELLESDEFTNKLFQLNGHGNILRTMKPQNIHHLAAVLAMIRPAKRYLIGANWDTIFKEVWQADANNYTFKKSHSYAYATTIIIQMNLLCEPS